MDSTVLRIDLAQPSDYFGFGAALNADVLPGRMTIELLDAGGVCLATRTPDLLCTAAFNQAMAARKEILAEGKQR